MTTSDAEAPPTRGPQHDALAAFLGRWTVSGKTFGTPQQTTDDPKGNSEPWESTLTATWYTGNFFLVHDERAISGGNPFDTISIMGVDAKTGRYFARSFENHGFYRHYEVTRSGRVWTLAGATERARVEFSEDRRRQTINWEWRPQDRWLPLCDRVAVRED